MFTNILFATTGSPACDNAAKMAFELAKVHQARLTVFHCVGIPSRGYSHIVRDYRSGMEEEVDQDYRQWVVEELQTTYEKQLAAYGNCEFEIAVGVPAREILRRARKKDVDAIVLGAHTSDEDATGARYRAMAGNTLQKVSKAARCPVIIVNRPCSTCWSYFSNIVCGVDFSKPSEYAFQFAYQAAREIGARLHIFHAVDLFALSSTRHPDQNTVNKALQSAEKRIRQQYLSRIAGFPTVETEVWEGVPYVEILKFAREKQADLIVMAHHARESEESGAALGSTVEQVLLRSFCPVASVSH
ncbi:MAG: universal stress protein, partial [Thermodesulfobacteriota bacterium]